VKRFLAWLGRHLRAALNGPYWGGITAWNLRLVERLRRVREAAANFLRRR
jgi:hypothetical protein